MKYLLLAFLSTFMLGTVSVVHNAQAETLNEVKVEKCTEGEMASADETSTDNIMPLSASKLIRTYDTYMEAYFRGLTTNIGSNQQGSCGYVSLAQLLSYYDSYLDDDIIPEQYDVISTGPSTNIVARQNSPGVMNDTIPNGDSMEFSDYLDNILALQDESLHAKLISIGNEVGLVDNNDDSPLGFYIIKQETILKSYFKEIGITDYDIEYASDSILTVLPSQKPTSAKIESYVKENIDTGYPVLVEVQAFNLVQPCPA